MVAHSRGVVVFAALLAVAVAACGSSPPGSQTDARVDATDADSAKDTPPDVGSDTPRDIAPTADVAADVTPDVPVNPDALPDAPVDATTDAVPDPFVGYRWATLPAPLGAPLSAITIDSEGTLYVGAGQAGFFKSTDEGASWRPVNRGVYDFTVGSLAAVGTTVFAGTSGLLRTDDRGATWQQLTYPDDTSVVTSIGAQGNLVTIGSASGGTCYTSTDGGRTFKPGQFACLGVTSVDVLAAGTVIVRAGDTGVVRSTDQGVTFNGVQGIMNGLGLDAQVRCDGVSTCYAIARTTPATTPIVLLKSTDAGATFTPLSAPTPGKVLAISDTGSVYVSSSASLPSMLARSDDGGATFALLSLPTTTGAIELNCTGPFAARGDKLFAACLNGVYRSYDKGKSWQPASGTPATGPITGFAQQMFVDTTATALGPTGDIYVIASGPAAGPTELQRSTDGGWTWPTVSRPFNAGACVVTGGGALECVGFGASPFSSTPVTRSDDHGASWRNVALPPGPASGTFNVAALASGGSMVYAGGNGVARSSDGGLTFQYVAGTPTVARLQVLRNGHLLAQESDASVGYRSADQGATWQPINSNGLSVLPFVEDAAGRLIRSTGSNSVEVSTDEGVTWRSKGGLGTPFVTGVYVPMTIDGAGNLFAFVHGPQIGTNSQMFGFPLWVVASDDGGAIFTPLPDPIPNPNATAFATDKQGRLIVATTGGVFRLDSDTNPGPSRPSGGNPDGGTDGP